MAAPVQRMFPRLGTSALSFVRKPTAALGGWNQTNTVFARGAGARYVGPEEGTAQQDAAPVFAAIPNATLAAAAIARKRVPVAHSMLLCSRLFMRSSTAPLSKSASHPARARPVLMSLFVSRQARVVVAGERRRLLERPADLVRAARQHRQQRQQRNQHAEREQPVERELGPQLRRGARRFYP